MAKIGSIYLGGREGHPINDQVYPSGVAFNIDQSPRISRIGTSVDSKWEIEVSKNQQVVVARTLDIIPVDQIISEAFSHSQKFLDLMAVFHHNAIMMKNPGTDFIACFSQDENFILKVSFKKDAIVSTSGTLTVYDVNGKLIENPPKPEPQWNPAYRYYRLSQSSSDLYDAYRNLYLSFESLLNGICPKRPDESEKQWFTRAITEVNNKVSLKNFVPSNSTDPIQGIVGTQYEHIRCKMFHSKDRAYFLPYEELEPKKVYEAYQSLIGLWRETVVHYYNNHIGGGGITYQGFRDWMDTAASCGTSMYVTREPIKEEPNFSSLIQFLVTSVPNKPSPSRLKKYLSFMHPKKHFLEKITYTGDYQPGTVQYNGMLRQNNFSNLKIISGIGTSINNHLIAVNNIEDGINPIGIDIFESDLILRLINKRSPKTIFT